MITIFWKIAALNYSMIMIQFCLTGTVTHTEQSTTPKVKENNENTSTAVPIFSWYLSKYTEYLNIMSEFNQKGLSMLTRYSQWHLLGYQDFPINVRLWKPRQWRWGNKTDPFLYTALRANKTRQAIQSHPSIDPTENNLQM